MFSNLFNKFIERIISGFGFGLGMSIPYIILQKK